MIDLNPINFGYLLDNIGLHHFCIVKAEAKVIYHPENGI